jgi:hypothetical protein
MFDFQKEKRISRLINSVQQFLFLSHCPLRGVVFLQEQTTFPQKKTKMCVTKERKESIESKVSD